MVLHGRKTDQRHADWFANIDASALSSNDARSLDLVKRSYRQATQLPVGLSAELAKATSACQHIWAEARAKDDVGMLIPSLTEVVRLKREEAACLRPEAGTLYDGLLDRWEAGMTSAVLLPMLDGLRTALKEILAATPAKPKPAPYAFDDADPLSAILSTQHEAWHGMYEQNLSRAHRHTPLSSYASMGLHESQSRLIENQIGRSMAYCRYLSAEIAAVFPESPLQDAQHLYAHANHVAPGFIRVDADELHYNLHIIHRTELERALIEGSLEVADLEAAWNELFEDLFGQRPPRPSLGLLQDVHWPAGLFGYFPTYTLGNIYAAALFAAMENAIGTVSDLIAEGELTEVAGWLRDNVHSVGSQKDTLDILVDATGATPKPEKLLTYLKAKFLS